MADEAAAPAAAPAPAAQAPAAAPAPSDPAPASAPAAAPAAPAAPSEPSSKSGLIGDEPADPFEAVPAKYRVTKDDGSLDHAATLAKAAAGYRELENRLGRADVRPKTAADYTVTVPEAMKESFKPDDPMLADFKSKAWAAGFNQKQLDLALGEFYARAPALVAGAQALDAKAAQAALQQVWKTPEEFDRNVELADRAVAQLGDGDPELLKLVRNQPAAIRFLAKIGAQLKEDSPPVQAQSRGGEDVQKLMASEAFTNPRHVDHKTVTEKVNAHFAAQPGANVPIV